MSGPPARLLEWHRGMRTLVVVMVLSSVAAAQPIPWANPTPPAPAPAPAPAPVPAPVSAWPAPDPYLVPEMRPARADLETSVTIEAPPPPEFRAIATDPASDRAWLSPTPETQRRGSWTYNNYELVVHGLSYGLTDRLQLTAVLKPAYSEESVAVYGGSLKYLVADGPLKLAVTGSFWHASADHGDSTGNLMTAGATASLCLDRGCRGMVGANIDVFNGGNAGSDDQSATRIAGYAALPMARHMKLLFEIDRGALSDGDQFEVAPGGIMMVGFRFFNSRFAGDLGIVMPVDFAESGSDDDNGLSFAYPLINFTYRP